MTFVSKLFFANKVESNKGKSQPKSGKYWQHMSVMITNFVSGKITGISVTLQPFRAQKKTFLILNFLKISETVCYI
jgi:hypothetical protein